ncbi:MAG: ABC transporter permease [Bacteroidales bacterium]|jgi:ABC-2 type transport system permease protein|nr:ABC transporter permease [Bacteroidales bacterium]
MNKIKIIIRREYLSRIKKKSFLVMTILGPVLISALWLIPFLLSQTTDSKSNFIIVDETAEHQPNAEPLFKDKLKNSAEVNLTYSDDLEKAQTMLREGLCDAVLEIVGANAMPPVKSFWFFGKSEPSLTARQSIENQLTALYKDYYLKSNCGVSEKDIAFINNPKIDFYSKNIITGEESYPEIKMGLGMVAGLFIYFFILFFGSQIMRSVSEEKMSRVVEVLVSSVKPVQLLLGKLIGVALVGLTQFLLWTVLTFAVITTIQSTSSEQFAKPQTNNVVVNERIVSAETYQQAADAQPATEIIQGLFSINYGVIIGMFLFYFITGYFLYASLFGAVGSLIDVDTDAQQFSLPVTIPLIIGIVCLSMVINNPSGPVAFWLSIIPLTSPVIMMVRIPFGVPWWEIALSAGLMLITIWGSILLTAKIYRTAILLYGKKITYKEIWKWLKYKN